MFDTILIIILLISPVFTVAYCKRTIMEYRHMIDFLKKSLQSISDSLDVIHQLLDEDDIPNIEEDAKENEV